MRHKNEIELQAERRVANAAFGFLSLSVFLKESSVGNLLRLDRLKGPMAVSRTDTHTQTERQIDRHMCVCVCAVGQVSNKTTRRSFYAN